MAYLGKEWKYLRFRKAISLVLDGIQTDFEAKRSNPIMLFLFQRGRMTETISVVILVRVSKGEALPVHFFDFERFQVDPVDGAHVDGEFLLLRFQHDTQG